MSAVQNLAYAIVQVAHNFGAVAVVGSSLTALTFRDIKVRRTLAWVVLASWSIQAASGAAFGAVSFYFYHQFPDIEGIAIVALAIKMACVAFGLLLMSLYLLRSPNWPVGKMNLVWQTSSIFSLAALTAAAFLRWFS